MSKTHYTCAELAALKLPGYPGTERAWRNLVVREAWTFREVKPKAGRWAVRREFQPSATVASLIASPMRFMGASDDVTLTLTVSFQQAQKILQMLKRVRRG